MEKELNIHIAEEPRDTLSMHPHKFALWLFIVSIIMLFAAFTSAYIVRQAEGNWLYFDLPNLFWTNSVVLIISSATMHWAVFSARRDKLPMLKLAIAITTILGFAFLVGQYYAWADLVNNKIFFTGGNPSESFLYVITGVHAFHIVSGLVFLLIALYSAFTFKIHSKNLTRIEMCATYWHFLDILWLYLFGFLLLYH
ncbi:MAG: cytochrome c oxidase subunit 3 [Microscillaceae bacterium]|nr:cytochrome c oxidase subunit 3 [Microscillaceae bacterium]